MDATNIQRARQCTVTWCLTPEATETTVQAFICRLDYCNALLYGIADDLLRRLQSIQNAAARLVTGSRSQTISLQSCDGSTGCL